MSEEDKAELEWLFAFAGKEGTAEEIRTDEANFFGIVQNANDSDILEISDRINQLMAGCEDDAKLAVLSTWHGAVVFRVWQFAGGKR